MEKVNENNDLASETHQAAQIEIDGNAKYWRVYKKPEALVATLVSKVVCLQEVKACILYGPQFHFWEFIPKKLLHKYAKIYCLQDQKL